MVVESILMYVHPYSRGSLAGFLSLHPSISISSLAPIDLPSLRIIVPVTVVVTVRSSFYSITDLKEISLMTRPAGLVVPKGSVQGTNSL